MRLFKKKLTKFMKFKLFKLLDPFLDFHKESMPQGNLKNR